MARGKFAAAIRSSFSCWNSGHEGGVKEKMEKMHQLSSQYLYEPVKQIRTFLNREPGQLLVAGGWEGAKGGVRQKVHSRHLLVDRAYFFS